MSELAAPPPLTECHLLVVASPGDKRVGDAYPLDPRFEHIVGRPPNACGRLVAGTRGILLMETTVTRVHARLVPTSKGWHMEDCGSSAGSWVNGEMVKARLLRLGDRLQFGPVHLELRAGTPHERVIVVDGGDPRRDPA